MERSVNSFAKEKKKKNFPVFLVMEMKALKGISVLLSQRVAQRVNLCVLIDRMRSNVRICDLFCETYIFQFRKHHCYAAFNLWWSK